MGLEKSKTKLETLQMAHTTTTERYRDVSSQKELCEDRMKDAKVKELGCEEAMNRMKTYNADTQNEQKMELARLRQELQTTKTEFERMRIGQEAVDQAAKEAVKLATKQAQAAAQTTDEA